MLEVVLAATAQTDCPVVRNLHFVAGNHCSVAGNVLHFAAGTLRFVAGNHCFAAGMVQIVVAAQTVVVVAGIQGMSAAEWLPIGFQSRFPAKKFNLTLSRRSLEAPLANDGFQGIHSLPVCNHSLGVVEVVAAGMPGGEVVDGAPGRREKEAQRTAARKEEPEEPAPEPPRETQLGMRSLDEGGLLPRSAKRKLMIPSPSHSFCFSLSSSLFSSLLSLSLSLSLFLSLASVPWWLVWGRGRQVSVFSADQPGRESESIIH